MVVVIDKPGNVVQYNVTLRRICATIFVVEKQKYYIF